VDDPPSSGKPRKQAMQNKQGYQQETGDLCHCLTIAKFYSISNNEDIVTNKHGIYMKILEPMIIPSNWRATHQKL